MEKKKIPLYAIVNMNFVGCAPKELTDLNDVEKAFLTPTHSYGYCFNYQGGRMMQMKGQMTFMRVEPRSLAKAVSTLELMGLDKHVVVLLSGKMTYGQKQKIEQLTTVRTDKMIAAVKWLSENHREWKNVDLEKLKTQIANTKPIRMDKSTTCESGNATVEEDIVFTCYFPDGKANASSGGFDNPLDFKEFVDVMQENNYDVHFKAELEREFVKGKEGDQLILACPLQFPYGVGGMDETRELADGRLTSKVDLSEYLKHLSLKSQREFQTPLFQLVSYSMLSRSRLLRSANLQLKRKVDAKQLAKRFDAQDLSKAIKARRCRKKWGKKISQDLLDAVDATARDLPHTNEASKKVRSSMEAMHHHFGMGSVFLTVTFDDENSLLMQILSDIRVDNNEEVDDLSDEELKKRAKKRSSLRIEFPGIAALNFEMMMDILVDEVIGWDTDGNCPNGKDGLFGKVKAMAYAVEEQGRKTLHAHFIIWIEEYDELQKMMFFGDSVTKRDANSTAMQYFDHLASTEMLPNDKRELQKAFDHEGCSVDHHKNRDLPTVPDEQGLRDLRHKLGYEFHKGEFASCPHCEKKWTYEELMTTFLQNARNLTDTVTPIPQGVEAEATQPKVSKARLYAKCVEYQKKSATIDDEPTECINYAYQAHASNHHKNCFRCNKLTGRNKKQHSCGKLCECRYRLPDRSRQSSKVIVEAEGAPWYEWNGNKKKQPVIQVAPKRNIYDLFQNVACRAISQSKFTCNSNVNIITDGPIVMYTVKYAFKKTGDDDTAEYSEMDSSMKRMEGPGHEDDKAESIRIICRAAFAHNKQNVISSTMASYLI